MLKRFLNQDSPTLVACHPSSVEEAAEIAASSIGERKLKVAKQHEKAERLGWRMEWIVTGWCDQLGIGTGPKEVVGTVYLALAERWVRGDCR